MSEDFVVILIPYEVSNIGIPYCVRCGKRTVCFKSRVKFVCPECGIEYQIVIEKGEKR